MEKKRYSNLNSSLDEGHLANSAYRLFALECDRSVESIRQIFLCPPSTISREEIIDMLDKEKLSRPPRRNRKSIVIFYGRFDTILWMQATLDAKRISTYLFEISGVRLFLLPILDKSKSSETIVNHLNTIASFHHAVSLTELDTEIQRSPSSLAGSKSNWYKFIHYASSRSLLHSLSVYSLGISGRKWNRRIVCGPCIFPESILSDGAGVQFPTEDVGLYESCSLFNGKIVDSLILRTSSITDQNGSKFFLCAGTNKNIEDSTAKHHFLQICQKILTYRNNSISQKQRFIQSNMIKSSFTLVNDEEIFLSFCKLMSRVFDCEGVSISIVRSIQGSEFEFEKMAFVKGQVYKDTIRTSFGYNVTAIKKNCIIVVDDTRVDGGGHFAQCHFIDSTKYTMSQKDCIQYFQKESAIFDERSAIIWPIIPRFGAKSDSVVIKFSYFSRSAKYNTIHVQELIGYIDLLRSLIGIVEHIEDLEVQKEEASKYSEYLEDAAHLHFYREAVRGYFHGIVHRMNHIEIDLEAATDIVLELDAGENDKIAALEHLDEAKGSLDGARELIKRHRAKSDKVRSVRSHICVEEDLLSALEERIVSEGLDDVTFEFARGNQRSYVSADKELLTEVVFNIVQNAHHAIHVASREDGLISLSVKTPDLGERIHILVSDNGCGMDDHVANRAFEYRYSTSSDRKGGGGLGLYFARRVVQQYGGRLTIRATKVGRGSTFELVLPKMTRP